MAESPSMRDLYSPTMGFIYVFNLIVGTGALTMPKAFASAGWLAGVILLILLAFMSYLSTTFVIEVMAIANAKLRQQKRDKEGISNDNVAHSHVVHVERSMYVKNRMTGSNENINANMDAKEEIGERRPLLDASRYEKCQYVQDS